MRVRISLAALACVAAVSAITLAPGDSVTITGCTTSLRLTGNVLVCASPSRTPTQTPTRTPTRTLTPSPMATSTQIPTDTPSAPPSATQTPTPSPTSTATYLPTVTKEAGSLGGLAIMGDSTQDEYAAPENARPAINWVEHLARSGLPVGQWGSWGGSRRTGYEFNWARSGAVSYNAVHDQAPGVAEALRSGRVSHVLIQIGINDLDRISQAIYLGTIDYGALDATAAGVTEAARIVAEAAPGRVMLAPIQDYLALDLVPNPQHAALTDPAGLARMAQALTYLNARIHAQAPPGVVWFDFNAAMAQRVAQVRASDTLVLAGQVVQIRVRGSGPLNSYINDPYMHPETAISGLFAQVWMEEMNAAWGLSLPTLTDAEIMTRAQ